MTPLAPCHGPVFMAATATLVILPELVSKCPRTSEGDDALGVPAVVACNLREDIQAFEVLARVYIVYGVNRASSIDSI
jgi:hypothetical protein